MKKKELATFGGGCFWCTEAVFLKLKGVNKVESGYAGGESKDPTYQSIHQGTSKHAECIQIAFDPTIISFEELLLVFFNTHDPTTLNRQGYDIGTQYRSIVFYHTEDQKAALQKVIKRIDQEKVYTSKLVTEIVPFKSFYKAEGYLQKYYEANQGNMYCQVVIEPKLAKIAKEFSSLLKS